MILVIKELQIIQIRYTIPSMKNHPLLLWFGLIFVVLATGCAQVTPASVSTLAQPASPVQVQVRTVEAIPASGRPTQVKVVVRGKLPDGCTQIQSMKEERSGSQISVYIQAERVSGECSTPAKDFERVSDLDVKQFAPGQYTVIVGNSQTSFELLALAENATPVPASASPTISAENVSSTPTVEQPILQSPSQTPQVEATAAPTQAAPVLGDQVECIDKAAFFGDVTAPDIAGFAQDTEFVKTWKIRNEGTCTWGQGYKLVFAGGNNLNGPQETGMPAAAPGDIIDVSVKLKSPTGGGLFTSLWEFQNPSGKRFGVNSNGKDLIWVKVSVSWNTPTPSSPGSGVPQSLGCSIQRNSDYENTLIDLINNARQQQNLPALELSNPLSAAAMVHSTDMACADFVDHTGSDGSSWFTRIAAQGYDYAFASENIYVGNPTFGGDAQGAFTWWMNSKVHRDNILSKKVSQIGIAYAFNPSSTYGGYYTLDFAKPTFK